MRRLRRPTASVTVSAATRSRLIHCLTSSDSRFTTIHLPPGLRRLYQSRSPHLLVVPRPRHSRSNLLSWRLGMAIRRAVVRWILEQKVGDSRGSRLMFLYAGDLDNHSLHAGRLGRFGRRVPGNDREGCIPDEGSGSLWCCFLFAAAGCPKSVARQYGVIGVNRGTSAGSPSHGVMEGAGGTPYAPSPSRVNGKTWQATRRRIPPCAFAEIASKRQRSS